MPMDKALENALFDAFMAIAEPFELPMSQKTTWARAQAEGFRTTRLKAYANYIGVGAALDPMSAPTYRPYMGGNVPVAKPVKRHRPPKRERLHRSQTNVR